MSWFENDEFWATFAPYMFTEERVRAAAGEVDNILALVGSVPSDVLDLACGPGRHAIAFARRGLRVTGVDRTGFLLERARAAAAAAAVRVEFVQQDMREFARPASFDLVVNLFTSFGYFGNRSDELRVLGNIRESLRIGGALVLDVLGKEVLARVFQDTRSEVASDGTLMVWRTKITDDWTRVSGEWHAVRCGVARCFQVDHWIYSGQELRLLLNQGGFSEVQLFGGFDGRAYDTRAQRLVAVART